MKQIVAKFIKEINDLLSDKQIKLRLSEGAIDFLLEKGFDRKMGARPLSRTINEHIKVPISKKILFEGIAADSIINVDRAGEGLTFTVIELNIYAALENSSNSVDHNGYITVV